MARALPTIRADEITGETFMPAHMFDGALRDSLRDATDGTTMICSVGQATSRLWRYLPAPLCFIPSVGGISHCPQECSIRDIARGADLCTPRSKRGHDMSVLLRGGLVQHSGTNRHSSKMRIFTSKTAVYALSVPICPSPRARVYWTPGDV